MTIDQQPGRRQFLELTGALGFMTALGPLRAFAETLDLHLPSAPSLRPLTRSFPQKGEMILQRTRPPLLETPFAVFDNRVFTPNDQFFVRWHLADIPQSIDVDSFRLTVKGLVNQQLSLSLAEILALPRFEIAAVNQCSGNSRGFFQPRVPGGEWGNGAMGNAKWTGVRLRDVLDKAGVKVGAVQVRFDGLDEGALPETPDFRKSLDIDHARDGEVMIAYLMNGEQLPILNGFPLRLVVPGWYSTYWVKMLNSIEVLEAPDENFWMKTAYRIPDTPGASVTPGEKGFKTVPINKMVPRSFITNLSAGSTIEAGKPTEIRGFSFGGASGVVSVEFSSDGGATWTPAKLGKDEGQYSFRLWRTDLTLTERGQRTLMVRATNTDGVTQPATPTWNPGGYMLNVIESTPIRVS
jgi:DMSO/TMAO reductase YedYZ molybdopterin-dependent catalytic subunit